MNRRFFGGGKNKGTSATNLQAQKAKQIESLRKALGATEMIKDVEYRVVFPHANTNLNIIITLPPQFPSEKPILKVQPAVTHPWVDANMTVVGCSSINHFSMHSDLGQAVQAVLEEFKKAPPAVTPQHYVLGSTQPTVGSAVVPSQGPLSSFPGQPMYVFPGSQPQAIPPPLPPRKPPTSGSVDEVGLDRLTLDSFSVPNMLSTFPALKDMKLYKLQELVDDEEHILEMVQQVPDLVSFIQKRESLSAECVQLAKDNLAKKPGIESLKESLVAKVQEMESLQRDYELVCEKHLTLSEQFHPSHIQSNLKVAVMEADEESEIIAQKFLDKEIDIDEFVKNFMEKRTLCHLRRAKEEKLNQIILSQGYHY